MVFQLYHEVHRMNISEVDMEEGNPSSQTADGEEGKNARVLRKRTSMDEALLHDMKSKSWYPLIVGEIKLRLRLPGIFSLDIDVPHQDSKSYSGLYDAFEGKYWRRTPKKRPTLRQKWEFECILCSKQYSSRIHLVGHLNSHMGYYIARCQKCQAKYFSLTAARNHQKVCLQNTMNEQ